MLTGVPTLCTRCPVSPLALSQGQGPAHHIDQEQSKATCLYPPTIHSPVGSLLGYCQPTGGKHQFKPQTLLAPMM